MLPKPRSSLRSIAVANSRAKSAPLVNTGEGRPRQFHVPGAICPYPRVPKTPPGYIAPADPTPRRRPLSQLRFPAQPRTPPAAKRQSRSVLHRRTCERNRKNVAIHRGSVRRKKGLETGKKFGRFWRPKVTKIEARILADFCVKRYPLAEEFHGAKCPVFAANFAPFSDLNACSQHRSSGRPRKFALVGKDRVEWKYRNRTV